MIKTKWIGYSNGVAYPVFAVKDDNIGLCTIEGCIFMCWCTFDKIVENAEFTNELTPLDKPSGL